MLNGDEVDAFHASVAPHLDTVDPSNCCPRQIASPPSGTRSPPKRQRQYQCAAAGCRKVFWEDDNALSCPACGGLATVLNSVTTP